VSQHPERPPTVVARYYLYQATVSFGFFSPVFTLFLLYRDLAYTQIAVLSTLHAVLTVVGEVPTGYVGDRIGRRNSLVLSSTFMTLSIVGFVVARSFPALSVLYVLWTLALVFRSGSDSAWLYDTLAADGDEDRFAHVLGRAGAVNRGVTVVTMLAGGLLYAVQPTLPFAASAVLNGAGVLVALSLPQNPQYAEGAGEAAAALGVREALQVLRRHLAEPPLRSFVLYVGLFFGVVVAVDTYVQPVATGAVGLPVSAMGPLYAGFTLVSAVASYYAGAVEDRVGVRGATVWVPVVVAGLLVAPVALPLLALPAFMVMRGSRTVLHPIVTGYLNDHAASVGRATVLSAASMVYALVRVPLYLVGGTVADRTGPVTAVALLGVVLLVGLAVVALVGRPVAETDAGPAGSTDSTG